MISEYLKGHGPFPHSKAAADALRAGINAWSAYEIGKQKDSIIVIENEDFSKLKGAEKLIFKRGAAFLNCRFGLWQFGTTAFENNVGFYGCIFGEPIYMHLDGRESPHLTFEETRFLDVIHCHGAKCELKFANCEFAQGLLLRGQYVGEFSCVGNKTKFAGVLDATACEFYQSFRLSGFTISQGPASTEASTAEVIFRDAKFRKKAIFTSMHFTGEVRFDGADFNDPTSFAGTVFDVAPAFYGATFNPETIFAPVEHFDRQFPDTTSPSAEKRYQTLKDLSGKQQALSEQLGFARLEMKSHGHRSKRWSLHNLYGAVADYGLSWYRPVLWLLNVTLAFALLFMAALETDAQRMEASIYALSNAFPFVGGLKGLSDAKDLFPSGWLALSAAVLAVLQSVISTTLLFLVALGIRNRLRMK